MLRSCRSSVSFIYIIILIMTFDNYYKNIRCTICYSLLSIKRSGKCIKSDTIERLCLKQKHKLITSEKSKFFRLWTKNTQLSLTNRNSTTTFVCYRCCETLKRLEQIQLEYSKLNYERHVLLKNLEYNLQKRVNIIQAQFYHHQVSSVKRHTIEHENKSFENINNKHHDLTTTQPKIENSTSSLVGAKRRKCKITYFKSTLPTMNCSQYSHCESSSSSSKKNHNFTYGSCSDPFNNQPLSASSTDNDHDQQYQQSFSSSNNNGNGLHKSLNFSAQSSSAQFLDTGALIAIVSTPMGTMPTILSNPFNIKPTPPSHRPLKTLTSNNKTTASTISDCVDQKEPTISSSSFSSLKKFPCLQCGRDFSNKSNLNRHHSIVHVAIRSFECLRCPKKFKLRQGLKTHMQRCHGVNTDEPTLVKQNGGKY
ncbi:unnamed protein product [Didymodactylos carnosus]|uniref:C2H2-type domain-containing protein n=1 Tax=Didymodactylos carnosus TaxID=1234261 RepID=A0A8S2E175_9BILA|nr:unnamed protein product [Didymodactylos carnosus]CAF3791502.1 unnamed protein product [Didymodactylos carnosus]